MSDAFHTQLVEQARADAAALRELGEHIGALHGIISSVRRADVDDLLRQFAALRADFQALHEPDMGHTLDRNAHQSWRARARRLAARVDEVAGHATRKSEHYETGVD